MEKAFPESYNSIRLKTDLVKLCKQMDEIADIIRYMANRENYQEKGDKR